MSQKTATMEHMSSSMKPHKMDTIMWISALRAPFKERADPFVDLHSQCMLRQPDTANDLNGSALHRNIENFITNLKQTSSTITKGLGKSVANDDLRSLLAVKEHLCNLAQSKENTENSIAAKDRLFST